jgi:hypothetical protein
VARRVEGAHGQGDVRRLWGLFRAAARADSPRRQRRKPGEILRRAVAGMLPKNKLRKTHMWRLRIFAGVEHPHALQLENSVPGVRRDDLFDNCDAAEDAKTYHKGRNTFGSYRQKDIDGPDEWHPERGGHKYAARPDKPRPNSREVK